MRKIIRAFVLILALAIPAFAGNIPNNLTGEIPNGATSTGNIPNGVAGEIPNNATGDIPYGATSTSPEATIVEALISLFASLIP